METEELQDRRRGDQASRRDFLRATGLAGVTLAVGSVMAGCAEGTTEAPLMESRGAVVNGNNVELNFANELDVLNYAYALEQLEAAFYVTVVARAGFSTTFPQESERRILVDLRDHEVAHRDFFKTALGAFAIPGLTPNFSTVNFDNRSSVLTTAQTFEDLGVGAYNGAARYLQSSNYLTVAGKIVSVEARHAAAIRGTLNGNRTGSFAPNAFDPAFTPQQVLTAADPFIEQNITVINT